MNLFKKALVASAVVASFGANATATVASTPLELSAEGAAAGVVPAAQLLSLDIVVGTDHPSASTITLTFDANVDLGTLTGLSSGVTTPVANDPALGEGVVGDITFSYGTGSFTFDNVTYTDNDQTLGQFDTISFVVNLGNPLTADSAFRIETTGTPSVLYSGIANVDYSAVTAGGDEIETGTSALTVTVPQFSFGSGLDFDAVINRDETLSFLPDLGAGNNIAGTDVANFSVTNDETLAGAIVASTFDLDLTGTFTGRIGSEFAFDIDGTAATGAATVTPVSEDGVQQEFIAAEIADDGTVSVVTSSFTVDAAVFTANTTSVVATGNITADFVLTGTTSTVTTAGFLPYTIAADLDAGEMVVDATTINVPYFPAGFTGTSSSVHFANESVNSSDVIVSAIDDDGIVHGPLDLGFDLAGNTVTKVTQTAIMSLFGLTESTKLSVTFNIEAEDGDVNAYAFTVSDGGRAQLVTSQQNNNQ